MPRLISNQLEQIDATNETFENVHTTFSQPLLAMVRAIVDGRRGESNVSLQTLQTLLGEERSIPTINIDFALEPRPAAATGVDKERARLTASGTVEERADEGDSDAHRAHSARDRLKTIILESWNVQINEERNRQSPLHDVGSGRADANVSSPSNVMRQLYATMRMTPLHRILKSAVGRGAPAPLVRVERAAASAAMFDVERAYERVAAPRVGRTIGAQSDHMAVRVVYCTEPEGIEQHRNRQLVIIVTVNVPPSPPPHDELAREEFRRWATASSEALDDNGGGGAPSSSSISIVRRTQRSASASSESETTSSSASNVPERVIRGFNVTRTPTPTSDDSNGTSGESVERATSSSSPKPHSALRTALLSGRLDGSLEGAFLPENANGVDLERLERENLAVMLSASPSPSALSPLSQWARAMHASVPPSSARPPTPIPLHTQGRRAIAQSVDSGTHQRSGQYASQTAARGNTLVRSTVEFDSLITPPRLTDRADDDEQRSSTATATATATASASATPNAARAVPIPTRTLAHRSPHSAAQSVGALCLSPRDKSPAAQYRFAGSLEQSLFSGHMASAISTVYTGFSVDLAVSGKDHYAPHQRIDFDAVCYRHDDESAPLPYVGTVALHNGYYRVPPKGLVQLTVFNPTRTPVKTFLLNYDVADMPALTKTFVRQRIMLGGVLKYALHLKFCSPRANRFYLYKYARIVFPFRSVDEPDKLRIEHDWPSEPKYFAVTSLTK